MGTVDFHALKCNMKGSSELKNPAFLNVSQTSAATRVH